MTEVWRDVVGYEGRYRVSNHGRVHRVGRPKALGSLDNYGYPRVALRRDGKQQTRRIHILVAEAFLGPRPPGAEMRHLDGNKLNSSVANLAYGTQSDNTKDMVRHGSHNNARKESCPEGHRYTPENTYIVPGRQRRCLTCKRAADRRRAP